MKTTQRHAGSLCIDHRNARVAAVLIALCVLACGALAEAITLQWDCQTTGPRLTGYVVSRSVGCTGQFVPLPAPLPPSACSYTDSTVGMAVPYCYQVSTVDRTGTVWPWSGIVRYLCQRFEADMLCLTRTGP
jgi:hypothetical protein